MNELTLNGTAVLQPLQRAHLTELCAIGLDDRIWQLMAGRVRTREEMQAWLDNALLAQEQSTALAFVIIERGTQRMVGSTRLGNLDHPNRRADIGWTWIVPEWQRTAVNTEAKYLLLRHAFEVLKCGRVQFKANAANDKSPRAILRIGAIEEGTLRSYLMGTNGTLHDVVHFSIVENEWPAVKAKLEKMMAARRG